ncbi:MAG: cytochrome c peroxidase [Bacteroidia bacterium]
MSSTKLVFSFSILLLILVISMAIKSSKQESVSINSEDLGRKLFFEKALSLDSSISCASCHIPEFAFSDTVAFSVGVGGRIGLRNAPSVMNTASRDLLFYDGRAKDLEDQVHFPIEDQNEMSVEYSEVINRLNADPEYVKQFTTVFGERPNAKNVAKCIADFERSLETSDTEFDDYMTDKPSSISESAIRGRELFLSDRAKCFDCHFGPDFTGDEFRNIGLYDEVTRKDKGRFAITKDSNDLGKFKVPGLRNIAVTGPYMHDGSFKTLEEVVNYYSNPYDFVENPIQMDSVMIKPIHFTEQEKQDLVSFLKALTDRQFLNR